MFAPDPGRPRVFTWTPLHYVELLDINTGDAKLALRGELGKSFVEDRRHWRHSDDLHNEASEDPYQFEAMRRAMYGFSSRAEEERENDERTLREWSQFDEQNLHHPSTADGCAGPGYTPYNMACTGQSELAALVKQAGEPWTPATNKLFPTGTRDFAKELLFTGYRLGSMLGENKAQSLVDVWLAVIMPAVLQRHMRLKTGQLVTFCDLNSEKLARKLNNVGVGKVCGEAIGAGSDDERWPVRVLGRWSLVEKAKQVQIWWLPAHSNGAIVTSDGEGLMSSVRPGPYKFRPRNLKLLNSSIVDFLCAREPSAVMAKFDDKLGHAMMSDLEEMCAEYELMGPEQYESGSVFESVRRVCQHMVELEGEPGDA